MDLKKLALTAAEAPLPAEVHSKVYDLVAELEKVQKQLWALISEVPAGAANKSLEKANTQLNAVKQSINQISRYK
jgi:hypothetical protein